MVGLGLLVLGAGGRWLLTTPRFAVRSMQVEGTVPHVAVEQMLTEADIPLGTNIFRLDTADVIGPPRGAARDPARRRRPRASGPGDHHRRGAPPFTLVHAGRLHWLDEEARLLGEQSARRWRPPVPVISGLSDEELATMRSSPGPKAQAAIALVRALLRSGGALAAEISEIDMSRREGPVLYTLDGIEVRLGTEQWDERLAPSGGCWPSWPRRTATPAR